jgi:hypothetical protein
MFYSPENWNRNKGCIFFEDVITRSRCSTVSTATRLRTGRPRSRRSISGGGQEVSTFSIASRPAVRPTQPPVRWVPRTVSPGVKWQWLEADHSPPFLEEVKNGGAILSPIFLHGVVPRNNFIQPLHYPTDFQSLA